MQKLDLLTENITRVPRKNIFQAEITASNDSCCRPSASVLPTDVDAPLLFEQDVGDLSAVELQVVLNVSPLGRGAAGLVRSLLLLWIISGE